MAICAGSTIQTGKIKIVPVIPLSSVIVSVVVIQRLHYTVPVSLPGQLLQLLLQPLFFQVPHSLFQGAHLPGSVFDRLIVYIIGGVIYVIIIINYI